MAVSSALGGSVRRREDPRLITGAGVYTDDVRLDRCLHGVVGIFSAGDLEFASATARPQLASDAVLFVGDAIAVAVAETRDQAVDAAAAVIVDYDPLPVVVDSVKALDGADVSITARFVNQRLAAVPIEANAVAAEPDGQGGIRLWASTQVPFRVRTQVADALGLPEAKVHVIAPDVGGAFGAKLMMYPEQTVLCAVALKLDRRVRWFEYRSENMVAMSHGRAQVQDVALGATRDGKLVGLDLEIVADCGADAGLGAALPGFTMLLSSGVYDIPKIRVRTRTALTNTTIVSAYRGAGRPEAIAMIERAMDMLAAELGLDPAELRRRNFIRGEFPFTTAAGATYDSGDYPRALDVALEAAGYDELRREQKARRERGDRVLLGVGISSYVEMTAVQLTSEFGFARVSADGSFTVGAGTSSSGQGHETAYAQLAASLLDVPMGRVSVVQSDTNLLRSGDGTYGSRSLQLGGSAVRGACIALVQKARVEAARRLEASVEDIERTADGGFGVRGVPGSSLSWVELAAEAMLIAEDEFEQDGQTFPFGCHVAVVEVDVETGEARMIRHVAVDDCGTILNPTLVEGQVHGGIAQGAAQALYEEFVYDVDGNPLTTSLVDYAIPTIGEIPFIETLHTETPSPLNPLGVKGIGESGTIGSTPAVQNAVIDAVSHLGVRHIDMPLHPMRVWEAIKAAQTS